MAKDYRYLTLELDEDFDQAELSGGGGGPVGAVTGIVKMAPKAPKMLFGGTAEGMKEFGKRVSHVASAMTTAQQAAAMLAWKKKEKDRMEKYKHLYTREPAPAVGFDVFDAFYAPRHRYGYAGEAQYVKPSGTLGLDWAEDFDEIELAGFFGRLKQAFTPPRFIRRGFTRRIVRPVKRIVRYTGATISAPFMSAGARRKAFRLTPSESKKFEIGAKVGRGVLAAVPAVVAGVYIGGAVAAKLAAAKAAAAGTATGGASAAGLAPGALYTGSMLTPAGVAATAPVAPLVPTLGASLGGAGLGAAPVGATVGLSSKLAVAGAAAKTGFLSGVMKVGGVAWKFANSPLGFMTVAGLAKGQEPQEVQQMQEGEVMPLDDYYSVGQPAPVAGAPAIEPWGEEEFDELDMSAGQVMPKAPAIKASTVALVGAGLGMIGMLKHLRRKR